MSEFHWLRPAWLLAFLPLLFVLLRLRRRRLRPDDWLKLCDPALLPHLLVDRPVGRTSALGSWLLALGASLAILALAGPVWERLPLPVFRNERALVIALDLSRSMDAADIRPSRVERARFKIADLLKSRKDGQTALVIFAGEAFTVSPLTDDAATIAAQLGALSTQLPPVQGQRTDLALDLAGRLLRRAGLTSGDVLLIAGSVPETIDDSARRLANQGYRLSVLGMGTEEGAPVPLPKGGFLKDAAGNILVPKLAAGALRRAAAAGEGLYRTVADDSRDLTAFEAYFEHAAQRQAGARNGQLQIEQWLERGPWLLLFLLPVAALAFRRGWLLCLPLLLHWPPRAEALDWRDFWLTQDQRAQQAFRAERYPEAAARFADPAWRAAAEYRAGNYQAAARALEHVDTTEAWYNKGNALAQLGRYPEAVAAYRKVLERDPNHADARHNLELLEEAMKTQPKAPQSAPDQEGQHRSGQDEPPEEREAGQGSESPEPQDASPEPAPNEDAPGGAGQPRPDPVWSADDRKDAAGPSAQDPEPAPAPQRESASSTDGSPDGDTAELGNTPHGTAEDWETRQANEQWLRRIPDDPAGLLKRKFYLQHQQRQQQPGQDE